LIVANEKIFKEIRKTCHFPKTFNQPRKISSVGKVRIEHAISEGRRLSAVKHIEQFGINRRLIARMIHVVCFLGKQELAFRGH